MKFLNKISPFWFILSFAIGMFFCYIYTPAPKIIVKFPSPENADTTVYKDNNNTCYKYKAEKTQCPIDKSLIKEQPISIEDYKDSRKKTQ